MGFRKITQNLRVCKNSFCCFFLMLFGRHIRNWTTLFRTRDVSSANRIMQGASPKTRPRSLIGKYILERLPPDYLTIHQCSGISLRHSIVRKDIVCHVRPTNTKSVCTAYEIRIHLSLYSYTCMYAYLKQTLKIRRLNRVFLADRKVL